MSQRQTCLSLSPLNLEGIENIFRGREREKCWIEDEVQDENHID